MAFQIRSEDDVFEAIELVDTGRLDDEIRFVDWPRLELTIRGELFDGGLPTRIMSNGGACGIRVRPRSSRANRSLHLGEGSTQAPTWRRIDSRPAWRYARRCLPAPNDARRVADMSSDDDTPRVADVLSRFPHETKPGELARALAHELRQDVAQVTEQIRKTRERIGRGARTGRHRFRL